VKVLLLLTRSPRGAMTGRKQVLRTIVESLQRLGHEVTMYVIETGRDEPLGHDLPPPLRVVANLFMYFGLKRTKSINECLYYSPAIRRDVRRLSSQGFDLVVADTVRTAQYAKETNLPTVVDLDDLLSKRYLAFSETAQDLEFLGYYRKHVPAIAKPLVRAFSSRLLKAESKAIGSSEDHYVHTSDAAVVVSSREAKVLSERTGQPVYGIPMSVHPSTQPWIQRAVSRVSDIRLVYTGAMDYKPNAASIRHYLSALLPFAEQHFNAHPTLTVLGASATEHPELQHPSITYPGYVDDLYSNLRECDAFLAPIVSGTGIKTKVLEAMMCGVPVISTTLGVEGIPVDPDEHYIPADSSAQYVVALEKLLNEPEAVSSMAARAQVLIEASFSPEQVAGKWASLLARFD
jgi:polysaccharide biosynthesis protein PslH